jgi:hypothetical protein
MAATSVSIDLTSVLATIKEMESRLAALRELVGGTGNPGEEGTKKGRKKRAKKERDPNAPKREANVWIKFTQLVDRTLKEGGVAFKRVADSKKFAKHLKDKRPYEEWDAASILEARKSWESWSTVEEDIASEGSAATAPAPAAVAEAAPSEKKRGRKPMTDEQKAAAKAKKAAEATASQ